MPEGPEAGVADAGAAAEVEMVEWKPAGTDVAVKVPKEALKALEGHNERWNKVTTREQAAAELEKKFGDPDKLKEAARQEWLQGLTADDWKTLGKELEFLPGDEAKPEDEGDPRDATIAELKSKVEKLAQGDEERRQAEEDRAWIAETEAKFGELAKASEDYAGYAHDLGKAEIENRFWDILANVEGATPEAAFEEALKAQVEYDKSVIESHAEGKKSAGKRPPGDSAGLVATPANKFLNADGTFDEKASTEDLAQLVRSMTS